MRTSAVSWGVKGMQKEDDVLVVFLDQLDRRYGYIGTTFGRYNEVD